MKHVQIDIETLQKMMNSFADVDEFSKFYAQLNGLILELNRLGTARSEETNELKASLLLLMQLFTFSFFCLANIDLIHDLIKEIDYQVLDDVSLIELKKIFEQN